MSNIKQIARADWQSFLEDFSLRNNNRRARFEVFKGINSEEERQEYFLEDISLKDENESKTIAVTRIDRTKPNTEKIHDKITNVTALAVQYDVDGSESVLEISDAEKELILLRFESKVDGVS
jgi:hypothetical protein